jgi:hypothetical protein
MCISYSNSKEGRKEGRKERKKERREVLFRSNKGTIVA